jgi:hypothetical protein
MAVTVGSRVGNGGLCIKGYFRGIQDDEERGQQETYEVKGRAS